MTTHTHKAPHEGEHPSPEGDATHAPHSDHGQAAHAGKSSGGEHHDHQGHEQLFRARFWLCLALSLPVLAYSPMLQEWFGFRAPDFPGSRWVAPAFALAVFLLGGVPFIRMAIPEVRSRRPGMMTLISLAIGVSFGYSVLAQLLSLGEGFFWELVTLIDIMLLGHWIEMRSVRRASGALDELAKLLPDTAEKVQDDGSTVSTPTAELATGDLVLVRPGASVPADGEVAEGRSSVNEAMVTGESQPVDKGSGDRVIAGTINGDGSLRVRVTATGDDTALAGIMRLVEEAQESKSDAQILADRAAGWLFYVALAVAAITLAAWLAAVGPQAQVLQRVVTVLVIACPHALGLAVPLVVAIVTELGARNGILVRDRLALEAARDVDTIVFDKTGTLTEGVHRLVDMATADGWEPERALAWAAAVEGDSEHMIAQAIRQAAQEQDLSLPTARDFAALKGRGVRAEIDGQKVFVGGPNLLEKLDLTPPEELRAFQHKAADRVQSAIYLIVADRVVAALAVADAIRPESQETVRQLREMGIQVAMLTGDSRAVAEAVAQELGLDRVMAEVLPEHKAQRVADLQAEGRRVAMVGDGINDAPALARADVGIAIGGGTDVAIESAGLILVRSNPADILKALALSRASYRKMIQNLWWAAGYNIVALPLAAGAAAPWEIVLSPAVGALLMSLSTVIVALNAQLLRRAALVPDAGANPPGTSEPHAAS
jgi:P-type Cu2+ transporter